MLALPRPRRGLLSGACHDSGAAMASGMFADCLALWVIRVTDKPFVERASSY